MKKITIVTTISGIIFVAGLMVFLSVLTYVAIAQTTTETNDHTIQGITFPVAELGNCPDKDSCRTYCNDSNNMPSCIAFAKSHGLMNEKQVQQAQKFAKALQAGNGPGGCNSETTCGAFCSTIDNLKTCIDFAEKQGVKDEHFDQGKKVLAYIESGGQMPGGCTSQESCQAYCGDFSHAQECYEFAKAAGVAQKTDQVNAGQPTPAQLQKLSELAKTGQTPGGCASKDSCETYCSDSSHIQECTKFGVDAGFITQDQADQIQSTGGKGPDGCDSAESCQKICNDDPNKCFAFAEEHGFSSHEEVKHAKESFVRVRTGTENMPPEVRGCLTSTVGPNVLDDIQSGKLVPGPEIGEQVKSCFEKFGRRGDASEPFKQAPPEVLSCLKEKTGDQFDDIESGKVMPTPEVADTFRVCFQQVQFQKELEDQSGPNGQPSNAVQTPGATLPAEAVKHFIETAPPNFTNCIQQLGIDPDKVKTGETTIDPSALQSCFNDFHPTPPPTTPPSETQPSKTGICPAMPTVDSCPEGQTKVVAFSSPECGTYYTCTAAKEVINSSAEHGCVAGTYWDNISNVCVKISDPAAACAQKGWIFNKDGSCTPPATQPPSGTSGAPTPASTSCPSDQYWNGTACVSPSPTDTHSCTSSQYWNGSACVSAPTTPPPPAPTTTTTPPPNPPPTDPATACAQQPGYYWTGTECKHASIPRSSELAAVLGTLQSIVSELEKLLSQLK